IYEKDGDTLKFNLDAMADDQVRVDMARMVAAQLQEHGVDVTARAEKEIDWAGFDAVIIGWGSPFDADDHTYKIFTTDAGDNYTGYSNKKIDKILAEARSTNKTKDRKALYGDFLEEMTKQMPYSFIAYVDADYAVRKDITGITPDTLLGHHGVGIFWNIADWDIES
ncbi:MAG: ABC transporter substrate-binding protein, partial [Eubacterium sp.]|nr:ABC transporter substrate-binding protein [Eubacterium sp.]